jgi:hypothetical protein
MMALAYNILVPLILLAITCAILAICWERYQRSKREPWSQDVANENTAIAAAVIAWFLFVVILAIAGAMLASPAQAKQPSQQEVSQRIYPVEVRNLTQGQFIRFELLIELRVNHLGSPALFYELPGGWYYVWPNTFDGTPGYFERFRPRRETLSLEDVVRLRGLPW